MNLLIWIGIVFCISQSAFFSGLNLAFFSVSKLHLEIESKKGNRHAMKTASLLSPVLRMYQFLLYPVAKPTSFMLDKWLGAEAIPFFRENDLRELLELHIESPETDIERIEGKGALNFLAIDDLLIIEEGEPIDGRSIIQVPFKDCKPVFPITERSCEDPFL